MCCVPGHRTAQVEGLNEAPVKTQVEEPDSGQTGVPVAAEGAPAEGAPPAKVPPEEVTAAGVPAEVATPADREVGER